MAGLAGRKFPPPVMQVTSNIVRFPTPLVPQIERVQPEQKVEDNVIAFAAPEPEESFNFEAREHGLLFAAHRIASRLADDLEHAATL